MHFSTRQVRFSSRQFTCPLVRVVRRNFDSYHVDSIGQPSDNLLTPYEKMETSFAKQLFKAYKGFEFRSLWNVGEKMESFQHRAVNDTKGTGGLDGVLNLKKALYEIEKACPKYTVGLICKIIECAVQGISQ